MRITGGEWRSRRLHGPGRGKELRPTPDALRERAFAVLGERVAGAHVIDLYSGTGAVGLEALSRGARSVIFVERHRSALRLIEKNTSSFDLSTDRAELLACPAADAIARLQRRGLLFDIAWADPPFEMWCDGLQVIVRLFSGGLLRDDALACLECPAKADVAGALPPGLEIVRDLAGGASRVVIIERSRR